MPHLQPEPTVPSTNINELRSAVARWEYEGGADITGPQEGYRIDGNSVAEEGEIRRGVARKAEAASERFDRLVRLFLAASAIRQERRRPAD